jgi:hypothetical protein
MASSAEMSLLTDWYASTRALRLNFTSNPGDSNALTRVFMSGHISAISDSALTFKGDADRAPFAEFTLPLVRASFSSSDDFDGMLDTIADPSQRGAALAMRFKMAVSIDFDFGARCVVILLPD